MHHGISKKEKKGIPNIGRTTWRAGRENGRCWLKMGCLIILFPFVLKVVYISFWMCRKVYIDLDSCFFFFQFIVWGVFLFFSMFIHPIPVYGLVECCHLTSLNSPSPTYRVISFILPGERVFFLLINIKYIYIIHTEKKSHAREYSLYINIYTIYMYT